MRLLKVMQRQDNYQQQESYNQSRTGGLPVPRQDDRYNSEPTSTSLAQQRNQPLSQTYVGQQQQVKVENSYDQTQCSYSSSTYKDTYTDTRQEYPNEAQEMKPYLQETVTQSHQPRPQALFENRAPASSSQPIQPSQPVISSTQNDQTNSQMANIFYENTVNKDSEIKLSIEDRQNLMNDTRSSGNSAMTSVDLVIEEVVSSQEPLNVELNLSQSEEDGRSQRPMSSDRTHVCMTCFKAFKNKPQLTQHELVHNNLRKHVCSYCEKSFKQLCHLNQHIRTHTGERPYKCLVEGCERSFAQLSNLHHHQKNHEEHVKRDLSRQFRCVICDRSYANESSLRTHQFKLHENLKSPGDGSLVCMSPPMKKRRKKQTSLPGDAPHLAVLNLSSDDEGPPTQVKEEGFSLSRLANQISPSSLSSNQIPTSSLSSNQISSISTSSNQISSTSLDQSTSGQTQNSLVTSPNEAINQILQKRLLSNPNVPELLRQHQHLLPSFPSTSRSREDTLNVTPFQPLPKVSELARSLPQNRATFNPDLPSQSHMP